MKKRSVNIRPYTRQFYRGNVWCIILALLQTVLLTLSNLLISWLLQQVLDLIAGEAVPFTLNEIFYLTLAMVTMIAGTFGIAMVAEPKFVARGMAQYKEFVYKKLSEKSISAFSGENTSMYISALSNDAAVIEEKYLKNLTGIMEMVAVFVGALLMMLWYSPILTGVSIGLSLLPVAASLLTGSRMAKAEKEVSDRNEEYISTLRDSLAGFSVIKSFKAEARMCKMFAGRVHEVAKAKKYSAMLSLLIQMFGNLANLTVQFGVFLVGAWLALSGRGVTSGVVMVFVQLLNYVLQPISRVPEYLAQRKAARGLIEKLATALEDNVRQEGREQKQSLNRGIRIEALHFAYEPGKSVLRDLNFAFEAGKSYAIVGASGSGKSTLLNLMMAASPDYTGKILYDDAELRSISSASLYDLVCTVQQNVFIFNASIRDNITMFADFPAEEIDRAIDLSGLRPLIDERGEGYLCGENGSLLSGGEKQRISIARSLLKKSKVLLVDEATASLDAQTSWAVLTAILELQDMTRIVVTHDLEEGLLRQFDCILTMKNGGIAEQGRFETLMERKGYFYSLFTVAQ